MNIKKSFVIACLLFCSFCNAQITLEHTLTSTAVPYFYCTDIGNNDYKYVFLNQQSNSFSLYNMDMSPFITNIVIPATNDSISQGFGVIYITKSLFDCDSSNIEYVFETIYDTHHKFRVYRTDATLLFELDSARGPFGYGGIYGGSYDFRPILKTSAGTKMFLEKNDPNNIPEILVYSLCGDLPISVFDFTKSEIFVKVYPNPSLMEINFEIMYPNNNEEFHLEVLDSNAKEIKEGNNGSFRNKYKLDVTNYSAGNYFYSLVSKSKVYQTGKFIIVK